MSDYINPARQQIRAAFRRGGAQDTLKLRFVCQQCGKQITLTFRQAQRGARPACSTCGPAAVIVRAADLPEQGGGHA